MITVFADNKQVETNYIKFSDGAITYKLDTLPKKPRHITVNVDPRTPVNEVREELTLIEDCFNNHEVDISGTNIILNIPYMPYGRADRRFEAGNPNPLLHFISFLSDGIWDEINTLDLHNESIIKYPVGDKVTSVGQVHCFVDCLPFDYNEEYDFIIAPDKGAVDKVRTIAEHLETDIAFAGKTRDLSTGRITGFTLPKVNLVGAKVLIPDDIFDGGGTFVGLAKALRDAGAVQVDLYVTHLIASKGLKLLGGVIDTLYYYHIVGKHINNEDVLNFNNKTI